VKPRLHHLGRTQLSRRTAVAYERQLVLNFKDGEGLSFQAIAAKIGKPIQAVASLYCRGRLAAVRAVPSAEVAS
jgi:DNA-directed RNA polymerase specialized sigma24 family protein